MILPAADARGAKTCVPLRDARATTDWNFAEAEEYRKADKEPWFFYDVAFASSYPLVN